MLNKPKPEVSKRPIRTKVCIVISQWELKLIEARENAGDRTRLFLVLHLIGWEDGASIVDQSQYKVK